MVREMLWIPNILKPYYRGTTGLSACHIIFNSISKTIYSNSNPFLFPADQEIPPGNYQPTNLEPVSGVTNNDALQKDDENKDTIPDTLIAILASCGALVLILCCFAAYCTYHRRSYRKNQVMLNSKHKGESDSHCLIWAMLSIHLSTNDACSD